MGVVIKVGKPLLISPKSRDFNIFEGRILI